MDHINNINPIFFLSAILPILITIILSIKYIKLLRILDPDRIDAVVIDVGTVSDINDNYATVTADNGRGTYYVNSVTAVNDFSAQKGKKVEIRTFIRLLAVLVLCAFMPLAAEALTSAETYLGTTVHMSNNDLWTAGQLDPKLFKLSPSTVFVDPPIGISPYDLVRVIGPYVFYMATYDRLMYTETNTLGKIDCWAEAKVNFTPTGRSLLTVDPGNYWAISADLEEVSLESENGQPVFYILVGLKSGTAKVYRYLRGNTVQEDTLTPAYTLDTGTSDHVCAVKVFPSYFVIGTTKGNVYFYNRTGTLVQTIATGNYYITEIDRPASGVARITSFRIANNGQTNRWTDDYEIATGEVIPNSTTYKKLSDYSLASNLPDQPITSQTYLMCSPLFPQDYMRGYSQQGEWLDALKPGSSVESTWQGYAQFVFSNYSIGKFRLTTIARCSVAAAPKSNASILLTNIPSGEFVQDTIVEICSGPDGYVSDFCFVGDGAAVRLLYSNNDGLFYRTLVYDGDSHLTSAGTETLISADWAGCKLHKVTKPDNSTEAVIAVTRENDAIPVSSLLIKYNCAVTEALGQTMGKAYYSSDGYVYYLTSLNTIVKIKGDLSSTTKTIVVNNQGGVILDYQVSGSNVLWQGTHKNLADDEGRNLSISLYNGTTPLVRDDLSTWNNYSKVDTFKVVGDQVAYILSGSVYTLPISGISVPNYLPINNAALHSNRKGTALESVPWSQVYGWITAETDWKDTQAGLNKIALAADLLHFDTTQPDDTTPDEFPANHDGNRYCVTVADFVNHGTMSEAVAASAWRETKRIVEKYLWVQPRKINTVDGEWCHDLWVGDSYNVVTSNDWANLKVYVRYEMLNYTEADNNTMLITWLNSVLGGTWSYTINRKKFDAVYEYIFRHPFDYDAAKAAWKAGGTELQGYTDLNFDTYAAEGTKAFAVKLMQKEALFYRGIEAVIDGTGLTAAEKTMAKKYFFKISLDYADIQATGGWDKMTNILYALDTVLFGHKWIVWHGGDNMYADGWDGQHPHKIGSNATGWRRVYSGMNISHNSSVSADTMGYYIPAPRGPWWIGRAARAIRGAALCGGSVATYASSNWASYGIFWDNRTQQGVKLFNYDVSFLFPWSGFVGVGSLYDEWSSGLYMYVYSGQVQK